MYGAFDEFFVDGTGPALFECRRRQIPSDGEGGVRPAGIMGDSPPSDRGFTIALHSVTVPIDLAEKIGGVRLTSFRGCRKITAGLYRIPFDMLTDEKISTVIGRSVGYAGIRGIPAQLESMGHVSPAGHAQDQHVPECAMRLREAHFAGPLVEFERAIDVTGSASSEKIASRKVVQRRGMVPGTLRKVASSRPVWFPIARRHHVKFAKQRERAVVSRLTERPQRSFGFLVQNGAVTADDLDNGRRNFDRPNRRQGSE